MITEPSYTHVFALDCETFLIGPEEGLTPTWVCLSAAWRDGKGEIATGLWGSDEGGAADAHETLVNVLEDDDVLIVGAKTAYDLGVIMHRWPTLTPLIFEKLAKGLVVDVQLAEKLLNLSTHGRLARYYAPDGSSRDIKYHLDVLEGNYFEGNRADQKSGDDIWRLNYSMLHGLEAAEYPREAAEYAIADSVGALRVYEAQLQRERTTHGTMFGVRHKTAIDFAYHLVSTRGIANDQDYIDYMDREVERLASPEHLPLLIGQGFLVPEQPPRPHARNKEHVPGCKRKGCNCPPVMCKGQDEKFSKKKFQAYVLGVCIDNGRDVRLTKKGTKVYQKKRFAHSDVAAMDDGKLQELIPFVATSSEVVDTLAASDPTIEEFQRRQSVQKILQDNKKISGFPVTHPQFDTLKETTRTSSYGASNLPSRNIQQVPNALAGMDPRRAHKPREGHWFLDADYDALELCQVAQTTYTLFGHSERCVHYEKINEGYDLHAFLGSQLALRKSPEFQQALRMMGAHLNERDVYHAFLALKTEGSPELAKLFKHFRTFAKPVGLGFPGGLGPATMVTLAASNYGVVMSEDEAREAREFWRETYPEMPLYFEWCNEQLDEFNMQVSKTDDDIDDDEEPSPAYWYKTPFGITRRGTRFCSLANGKAMQSPAAEGFNLAMWHTQRACYDWTMESPLYGSGVVVPLHDQIVLEIPADLTYAWVAAAELKRIMVESMKVVCPDVRINADPILCSRWSKSAEAVFDDQGRLALWTPSENPHLKSA